LGPTHRRIGESSGPKEGPAPKKKKEFMDPHKKKRPGSPKGQFGAKKPRLWGRAQKKRFPGRELTSGWHPPAFISYNYEEWILEKARRKKKGFSFRVGGDPEFVNSLEAPAKRLGGRMGKAGTFARQSREAFVGLVQLSEMGGDAGGPRAMNKGKGVSAFGARRPAGKSGKATRGDDSDSGGGHFPHRSLRRQGQCLNSFGRV